VKEFSRRLANLDSHLSLDEPVRRIAGETAAVAVILKTGIGRGDSVLLIRRTARSGDPWSGQIAFPGGRVEPTDASFAATAARETSEEVGFDLASRATFLGYMDPVEARNRRVQVVPVVFLLTRGVRVLTSREVASHHWIPLGELLSEKNRTRLTVVHGRIRRSVSAFEFGDYVVWGLTERLLTRLARFIESS